MSNPACLLIADISGYTSYLASVELDHAQDILADLMNTVIKSVKPTFRLAKLEGDAAFSYALTDKVDPSELQDVVEGCYFSFRRRLRDIKQASSCECNACTLMPNLNLKILVHHGAVAFQEVAGRKELVGSDVVLAHRLLKNSIDLPAYALYTEACLRAADHDPEAAGMTRHVEEYEHIGTVVSWVSDLEKAWKEEQERTRYLVDAAKAATWTYELPARPQSVWIQLTAPGNRLQWQSMDGLEAVTGGRRGQGTVNHCQHGADVIIEEFIDWQPYEYFTNRFQMPGAPKLTISTILTELPGGVTSVEQRLEKPRGAKAVGAFEVVCSMFATMIPAEKVALTERLAVDESSVEGAPDEEAPQSEMRYLSPV